jgi:transposase
MKLTAICIIDDAGNAVMERVVASDPDDISRCIEEFDGESGRIGLEAGPLAPWLFGGLAKRGLPVVCIEVRQMKAFAKASPIKTDRRDARLIAQAMRTGLFKIAMSKLPTASASDCCCVTARRWSDATTISSTPCAAR